MNDYNAAPPLIRIDKEPWGRFLSVLVSRVQGGKLWSVRRLEYEENENDAYVPRTLEISASDAQSLMDQLWECGLRPSEGSGSAGALAATQSHLADFRRLVFDDPRLRPAAQADPAPPT
jgi:hypothetical protein